MEDVGVKNIIFTDISRDGTLTGPNLEQLVEINNAVSCDITASGGVTNINDIRKLKNKNTVQFTAKAFMRELLI